MPSNYTGVDPTVFGKKHEESQNRRSGFQETWSPRKGGVGRPVRNVFRLMPPHLAMGGHPIHRNRVHFSLGPNQDTTSPCLAEYAQLDPGGNEILDEHGHPIPEECPACLWVAEVRRRGLEQRNVDVAKQYKDMAQRMRAQDRWHAQIVDMGKPELGVQRYSFGSEVEKL